MIPRERPMRLTEFGRRRRDVHRTLLEDAIAALDRESYEVARDTARTASDAMHLELVRKESPNWEPEG